jgi:hypothetical protein
MILGKANVMSYEALEEARAKRAAKEAASTEKGKRVRKRKDPAAETVVIEIHGSQPKEAPGPWRAPVARMIAGDWLHHRWFAHLLNLSELKQTVKTCQICFGRSYHCAIEVQTYSSTCS